MNRGCQPRAVNRDEDRVGGATPESFDEFYGRTARRAARLGHLLTGSAATGHDLAHDAFVEIHNRWSTLASPDAYLRAVIVNRSRRLHRRSLLERAYHARFRPAEVTAIPELDEAWQAVRRLPPNQRAVVVLRFYEDLPVADIADVLGLPPGTVKSTLHRALRRLQELLQ